MEINPNFLAPCGLYCGVCGVYYATKDKNEKFKERRSLEYIRENSLVLMIFQ